jgi:hypothetical protein
MLQFLLADYLTGYKLPALRKTGTTRLNKITWTLTSKPNTYTITVSERSLGCFVDQCHCDTVALRIDRDDVFISLLEDRSERLVRVSSLPSYRETGALSLYLIEGE